VPYAQTMRFGFATATRIVFGEGALKEVGPEASAWGGRALVVTGRTASRARRLLDDLSHVEMETELFQVPGEPSVEIVGEALASARRHQSDLIIAIGGGSVLDTGKAVAALLANGGEPLDYLEGIGRGKPLTRRAVPCIAIPTTAGTGSEVTRNAVLGSAEHRVKVSMRSPLMLPALAVVDPELTYSLSPDQTAGPGLDTLTQLIEAYVSSRANPLTDGICCEGLPRGARSLRRAYENGADKSARRAMSMASLFGGLALANAGLGAAHGFAGPIGGLFPAPHGALCACLLPHVMATNVRALQERGADEECLARYDRVARMVTGRPDARASDGIEWVGALCRALRIPALSTYGIREKDFPTLIEKAKKASSMRGNPIALTEAELEGILQSAV